MIHHKLLQFPFFLLYQHCLFAESVLQGECLGLFCEWEHVLVDAWLDLLDLLISDLVLEILRDHVYHFLHVIEHWLVIASIRACCVVDITADVETAGTDV